MFVMFQHTRYVRCGRLCFSVSVQLNVHQKAIHHRGDVAAREPGDYIYNGGMEQGGQRGRNMIAAQFVINPFPFSVVRSAHRL